MKTFEMKVTENHRIYHAAADRRILVLESEGLPSTGAADAGANARFSFDFDIADVDPSWAPGTTHTVTIT